MPISAIHHVAINVSDLQRSLAFYRDALGFRQVLDMKADARVSARMLRLAPEGLKIRSIMMTEGSSMVGEIELMSVEPRPAKPTAPKRPDDLGMWVISFEVKGEPLADVVKRLHTMGVMFFSDIEEMELEGYAPMKAVLFEDPDGNLLELVQLPTREEYLQLKKQREARAGA
jgi:lactoylglutathione lyase